MTLRSFLYAVEALRKEEGVRFHVETPDAPEPTPADVRSKNAQAMDALAGIMAGVQGRRR